MTRPSLPPPDPRQIEFWARRYAQSRSLPFLLQMLLGALLFGLLVLVARQVTAAYMAPNPTAFWVWLLILCVTAFAGLVAFFFSPFADRLRNSVCERLYGEGGVTLPAVRGPVWRDIGVWAALAFSLCLIATAHLAASGVIPRTHIQPWSALYFVPFLTFLVFWQQPIISPRWGLLWPALYALHAVALATGLLPPFDGELKFLNMVIPLFGYGLLAALAGHLQGRHALRRLRELARVEDTPPADDAST